MTFQSISISICTSWVESLTKIMVCTFCMEIVFILRAHQLVHKLFERHLEMVLARQSIGALCGEDVGISISLVILCMRYDGWRFIYRFLCSIELDMGGTEYAA